MTNERTNEQTQAAINPAGELPALPKPAVPAMQRGYPGMQPSYTQPDYYTADQMHAYAREALAASHRERSDRDVPNGANCTQSEVDPLTQYAADFIDGWIEGESEEVKRNWTRVRKAVLVPPSLPADKPAGQAVTDAMVRRFLRWELPADVAADQCATWPGQMGRCGTNLLTHAQARAMLEHVLEAAPEPATAGDHVAPLYTHPVAATVRDASVDPALTLDVARELLADCARAIDATPAAAVPVQRDPAAVEGSNG